MKLIKKAQIGDAVGYVYLEKLGYTWRIKRKINNKTYVVSRSYSYIFNREVCEDRMNQELQNITNQPSLF